MLYEIQFIFTDMVCKIKISLTNRFVAKNEYN